MWLINVGIDFLEFKPSEIAVAIAISVLAEIQAVDVAKAVSYFTHLEKVMKTQVPKMLALMGILSKWGRGECLTLCQKWNNFNVKSKLQFCRIGF